MDPLALLSDDDEEDRRPEQCQIQHVRRNFSAHVIALHFTEADKVDHSEGAAGPSGKVIGSYFLYLIMAPCAAGVSAADAGASKRLMLDVMVKWHHHWEHSTEFQLARCFLQACWIGGRTGYYGTNSCRRLFDEGHHRLNCSAVEGPVGTILISGGDVPEPELKRPRTASWYAVALTPELPGLDACCLFVGFVIALAIAEAGAAAAAAAARGVVVVVVGVVTSF